MTAVEEGVSLADMPAVDAELPCDGGQWVNEDGHVAYECPGEAATHRVMVHCDGHTTTNLIGPKCIAATGAVSRGAWWTRAGRWLAGREVWTMTCPVCGSGRLAEDVTWRPL